MAAKHVVSPAWVVVRRETGCERRRNFGGSKVLVVTKNEFGACEIEIAEGVVISTPSATHLLGLPYPESPLSLSFPPTSAPLLQNVAHIPR